MTFPIGGGEKGGDEGETVRDAALYRILATNATDMISTHRPNGAFDFASPTWADYVGIPGEALAGRLPAEFCHPDDLAEIVANHVRALKSLEILTTHWRCRHRDGTYGWLETTTRPVRAPGVERVTTFVCATRDISERVAAERALRESERRLREMFEATRAAAVALDADGRVTFCNAAACTLTGYGPEQLLGQSWMELCIPVDSPSRPSRATLQTDGVTPSHGEYEVVRRDGERRLVAWDTTAIRDPTGRFAGTINLGFDVTERRREDAAMQLVRDVTVAIARAADLDEALRVTIDSVCDATGWDYGEAWLPNADGTALERSTLWHALPGVDAAAFACASVELRFAPGEGIPGRAWSARDVVWVRDISRDPNVPRAELARAASFNAAVAIPIQSDDVVVAVLVFFARSAGPDDQRRTDIVSVVAAHIGALVARRRAEHALADERQFLVALLDNLSEGIIACDVDGRVTLFNRAVREMHGLPAIDMSPELAVAHYSVFRADGVTPMAGPDLPLVRVMRGEEVRDVELVIAPGGLPRRILSVNGRAIVDAEGRQLGGVVAARDVTAWKEAQEALVRSEARFRAAADGSLDAFFILEAARDETGCIVDFVYTDMNAPAEAIFGRRRAALLGQRITHALPESRSRGYVEQFSRVVETREVLEEEVSVESNSGTSRWFRYQVVPLSDGVAVTSREITAQKEVEEELRALSLVDDLTRLGNRRSFRTLAEQHLRLSKRGGPRSYLFYVDVDDFKGVNDSFGHALGDSALRTVASVLRATFRDSDILARIGGDEFVAFALDCGERLEELLERLSLHLGHANASAGLPFAIVLSVGVSCSDPAQPSSLDALTAAADGSLYDAKRAKQSRSAGSLG